MFPMTRCDGIKMISLKSSLRPQFQPMVGSGSTASLRQNRKYPAFRSSVAVAIAGVCILAVVFFIKLI